ncbi:MAG: ATP-binding protein [Pseudomonadota bacterium]
MSPQGDDRTGGPIDPGSILSALPFPTFVVDEEGRLTYANLATEHFFETSAAHLVGHPLTDQIPEDSPVHALIAQALAQRTSVSEYEVTIDTPRTGARSVTLDVAPIIDHPNSVSISIQERTMARKMDRQLVHRNAARSVTAMSKMLLHEVKNPLSGIRGAAQLLEQSASPDDTELTRLICDETDRIVSLVNRMEVFSDQRPIERGPVNIHQVLEHVRRIAQNGFGSNCRFIENYDPSLPMIFGNRDLLIQVFLNLIKNAAEAAPEGEIVLETAYKHGVRLAVPGHGARVHLPLVISVTDNGPGIPEDLKQHLFEAFVTSKANGTGLGLALVAKAIGDHGGIIEFDSRPRRTAFRVMLPVYTEKVDPEASEVRPQRSKIEVI